MTITIGRLAQRAGVNVQTVRYYERRGLLPEPPRSESGYRRYSPDAVRRIRFIKRAQGLGFTLEEITELFALRIQHASQCDAVERRARLAMARIEAKAAELASMRSALAALVHACCHRRATDDCPILQALDEENP